MNYKDILISKTRSIRDAMKLMDKFSVKILFVTEENILLASLTDGDIRNYLLQGGNLEDSVDEAANFNPYKAYNVDEAADKFYRLNSKAIPIVDIDNAVVDIYIGEKIIRNKFNIPVVINAGGKGTRLNPFTLVLPKPLIPIGELPIIEHIMREFQQYGCENFNVIVNYKKQLLKAYFNESKNKYDIGWFDEEIPLGTGGGLSLLKDKIKDTFFFTNCDILLKSNYECILKFHKENKNVITMVCAYKNLSIPYGVVKMGENGSILSMKEKPELSFLTNTGFYIVEPEVLYDVPCGTSIGFPDIIKMQITKGRNVSVYPVNEGEWLDMGEFSELEKMKEKICLAD